jgi:hypothetical protein
MSWMPDSLFNLIIYHYQSLRWLFLCPECRTHCLTLVDGKRRGEIVSMSWMSDSLFNRAESAPVDPTSFLCPECRTHCLTKPYDNDFVRVIEFLCPECRTHCLTLMPVIDSSEEFLCPECRTHCLTSRRIRAISWSGSSFYVLNVGLTV